MKTLLTVAEGIMDSAAAEYRAENLSSAKSVQAYAENGLNVSLSTEQAKRIMDICQPLANRMDSGEVISENDWFHEFTRPLSEDE